MLGMKRSQSYAAVPQGLRYMRFKMAQHSEWRFSGGRGYAKHTGALRNQRKAD